MKICLFTSGRQDWGLLEKLAAEISMREGLTLQIIATGGHLSLLHGRTIDHIKYPVDAALPVVLAEDSRAANAKGAGMLMMDLPPVLERLAPDVLVLLGDRFETCAAAQVAKLMGVKIAHIHGGERTGHWDDAFRWAISHMADVHFPATKTAAFALAVDVIIGRGDKADIFECGCLGADGVSKWQPNSQRYKTFKSCSLVYHPMMEEPEDLIDKIYDSVRESCGFNMLIGPNFDAGFFKLKRLEEKAQDSLYWGYLQREEFLIELSKADFLIGNSSSGIIEAPAMGIPSVNIGSRQDGREKAKSVIDCEPTEEAISAAIDKALSREFIESIKGQELYYKGENVAHKMVNCLVEWHREQNAHN